MTAPVFLPPAETIGQTLQPSVSALVAALQEKRQREQRQQQLLMQAGELKLAQDKFKAEQEATKERKQRLDQAQKDLERALETLQPPPAASPVAPPGGVPSEPTPTTGASTSAPTLSSPVPQAQTPAIPSPAQTALPPLGPVPTSPEQVPMGEPPLITAASVRMLMADGSPEALRAASSLVYDELQYRRAQTVLSLSDTDVKTPEGRATLIARMAVVDPQRAQALSQMYQTMGNRMRSQIVNAPGADGMYHIKLIDMNDGQVLQDYGRSRDTWVERLNRVGDPDQRRRAEGAGRMFLAWNNLNNLKSNKAAFAEAARAATAIGVEMQFPFAIGDFIAEANRVMAQQNISGDAQVILGNLFDFIAAQAFADGGKTLTRTEYTLGTRSIAPVAGESSDAWNDKFKRMESRWVIQKNLSKDAWNFIKDDLPGLSSTTTPAETNPAKGLWKELMGKAGIILPGTP